MTSEQKPSRVFALTEQQLAALQEYFQNTPMPRKQSDPYLAMPTSLPELQTLQSPEAHAPPDAPVALPALQKSNGA